MNTTVFVKSTLPPPSRQSKERPVRAWASNARAASNCSIERSATIGVGTLGRRVLLFSRLSREDGPCAGQADKVPRPEILFSLSLEDNFDPPSIRLRKAWADKAFSPAGRSRARSGGWENLCRLRDRFASPVIFLINTSEAERESNSECTNETHDAKKSPVILVFNRRRTRVEVAFVPLRDGGWDVHASCARKSSRLFFACLTGETDWPGAMVALVVGARGARLVPLKGAAA